MTVKERKTTQQSSIIMIQCNKAILTTNLTNDEIFNVRS